MAYFARDIRDAIISKLNSDFNSGLSTIDSNRGDTTPTPKKISDKWDGNQFPYIHVDVETEEIDNEEILSCDLNLIPKIFTVNVMFTIKTNKLSELENYVENYIENIEKILHGYRTADITWVILQKSERSEVYINNNQNMKMAAVVFEVRIN